MKFIERLFEIMVKYQEVKFSLKNNHEELKIKLRLLYEKNINDYIALGFNQDECNGFMHGFQKGADAQQLIIADVSDMLCGSFDADLSTSSATKCKCGREKWEHPKPRN